MASAQQAYKERLEPVLGEPLVRGLAFQSSRARSMTSVLFRLGQRSAGRGGLNAQIGQGNYVAVTATRVVLIRGLQDPLETFGDWPRATVSGSAERKHIVTTGNQPTQTSDQWVLRTTLSTPDGPVTFDLDEERGGRPMLKALGVPLPPLKPKTWWRTRPFD